MLEAGDGGEQEGEADKEKEALPNPKPERAKQTEQQQQQPQEKSKHEGHTAGQYLEGSTTTRAFGALTLKEEKHLMIAKAHLAVAADCRRKHLASKNAKPEEVEKAAGRFDQLLEELRQNLDLAASCEAISHDRTMMQVALVPKLWDDRDFSMKVIKAGGAGVYMGCRNPGVRDDKEMLLLAVASNPAAILGANPTLEGDREVWLAALQSKRARDKPSITCFLGDRRTRELLGDKEVMAAAVACDPWALAKATAEVRADRDVVLAALRAQTPSYVAERGGMNVLAYTGGLYLDDKEVVLEAARSGAAALHYASLSLKSDKAFMLRATRCVPAGEQQEAYNQVGESVWRKLSWEDWKGAARSVLAIAGDPAPILTVRLLPPTQQKQQQQGESISCTAPRSCEVTLLSGASFACELPASFDDADADWQDDDDDWGEDWGDEWGAGDYGQPDGDEDGGHEGDPENQHQDGEREDADGAYDDNDDVGNPDGEDEGFESEDLENVEDAVLQPAPKRRKVDSTADEAGKTEKEGQKEDQSLPGATVAQLARVVLKELQRQVEMDPPPTTIFLAFLGETEDGESTVATAWDWNRLVNDFL